METSLDLSAILEGETFDGGSYLAVKELAFAGKESMNRFLELLATLEQRVNSGEVNIAGGSLKLGMSYLLLGRTTTAIDWLQEAEDVAERAYYLGLAYRDRKRHEESLAQFEKAAQRGWDRLECECQRAESLLLLGRTDEALVILDQNAAAGESEAQWHFVKGRYWDHAGELEKALDAFERAIELDAEHPYATFHLAYLLHLHGADERAKELYLAATDSPFVHVNSMMNLAVIYEDDCQYDKAAACLRRVLVVDPDHRRAKLYLKDVVASGDMYIDEQLMVDSQKRNAVLDIPVTDFELSVRSRNCLKKMNIHTLGDLLRASEAELLSYKNFGETSLKEIKVMLDQKGLSLGQLALERNQSLPASLTLSSGAAPVGKSAEGASGSPDRPVSDLELSVRARKCIQLLGITTVAELVERSEAELLASRNFGLASLDEIKKALNRSGLSLRAPA